MFLIIVLGVFLFFFSIGLLLSLSAMGGIVLLSLTVVWAFVLRRTAVISNYSGRCCLLYDVVVFEYSTRCCPHRTAVVSYCSAQYNHHMRLLFSLTVVCSTAFHRTSVVSDKSSRYCP